MNRIRLPFLPACAAFRVSGMACVAVLFATGCKSGGYTLENTAGMSHNELVALCQDLNERASQDCTWNARLPQSSIQDRQTWEVNCEARRESARESYDNVCDPSRLALPDDEGGEHR